MTKYVSALVVAAVEWHEITTIRKIVNQLIVNCKTKYKIILTHPLSSAHTTQGTLKEALNKVEVR